MPVMSRMATEYLDSIADAQLAARGVVNAGLYTLAESPPQSHVYDREMVPCARLNVDSGQNQAVQRPGTAAHARQSTGQGTHAFGHRNGIR